MGSFVPSLKVNPLDLSPNYAGTLMAIVGGIGAVTGIFAPCLVAFLTTDVSITQHRIYVYFISNIKSRGTVI